MWAATAGLNGFVRNVTQKGGQRTTLREQPIKELAQEQNAVREQGSSERRGRREGDEKALHFSLEE